MVGVDDRGDVCGLCWFRCRVGLPDGYVEAAMAAMNTRDIKVLTLWFKERIKALEISEHYGRIREGVNRLVGFVEVLEGELDEQFKGL